MPRLSSRRDVLKSGLTLAALGAAGRPAWMLPALAQGETLVPFTDLPPSINLNPAPDRRLLDVRTITGPLTPKDQFFTTQHYGHPKVDVATYTLRVSGSTCTPCTALNVPGAVSFGVVDFSPHVIRNLPSLSNFTTRVFA